MNILLTGDLTWVTNDLYNVLNNEERKIVLFDLKEFRENPKKNSCLYSYSHFKKKLACLLRNYRFTDVIFFSGSIDGNPQKPGEIHELKSTLELCTEYQVRKLIYITTTEIYAGVISTSNKKERSENQIFLNTAEELCTFYNKTNLNVIMLHVPYLFDKEYSGGFIGNLLKEGIDNHEIIFPYPKVNTCDFLSVFDLGVFISRLLDSWDERNYNLSISSGDNITFEELGNIIKRFYPDIDVIYTEDTAQMYPVPIQSDIPRKDYGWFSKKSILEELPLLIEKKQCEKNKKSKSRDIFHKLTKMYGHIRKVIELIVLFLGIELINTKMEVFVQFKYIDLRLLYVVIMASTYGTAMGVIAAFFVCLSNCYGYMALNVDWKIIFYNADNWLPFVFYILCGAIIGTVKDKDKKQMAFFRDQKKVMEEKYLFLEELYESSLKNQEVYREQIVSSRESYGKLYGITKRLECEFSDNIYRETLKALEDTLDIQSVAIYCTESNNNLRLKVCSEPLQNHIGEIINLQDYEDIEKSWKEDEVWINNEALDKYPMYCMKLACQDKVIACVCIFEKEYTKTSIYNCNLIKVICGLAENALYRADQYQEMMLEQRRQ